MKQACTSRYSPDERGAVLLEWAIVAFGLIFGFLIFIDLANMLTISMELTRGAFEGARAAENYPQLEIGSNQDLAPTPAEYASCISGMGASTFPCGHHFVQQRARISVQRSTTYTSWMTISPAISVSTRFIPPDAAAGASTNTVGVSVAAPYSGFIFRNFQLSASFQGPYLFR